VTTKLDDTLSTAALNDTERRAVARIVAELEAELNAASPTPPLSKVVVRMQGGKKGLIVNSTNLCGARRRANARLSGHNGRVSKTRPLVRAQCGKGDKKGKRAHKRRHR
jgi:hypothetical protein